MNSSSAHSGPACPICEFPGAVNFFSDQGSARSPRNWPYFHCNQCDLIFRDAKTHLSREDEHAQYQAHNNDVSDPGYLRFLQPAYGWVCQFFPEGSRGLDYGCGPGPALALRLENAGYQMSKWDPFFFPDESVLPRRINGEISGAFDFITCTEVFEHFREPGEEFNKLLGMLKPSGHLIVRTQFHEGESRFPSWTYRIDPTHVSFFSRATFQWLAREFELSAETPAPHHVIFKRLRN